MVPLQKHMAQNNRSVGFSQDLERAKAHFVVSGIMAHEHGELYLRDVVHHIFAYRPFYKLDLPGMLLERR